MVKKLNLPAVFLISVIFFLISVISIFAEEQITITTYYPSPYGSYRELDWGNYPNTRGKLQPDQGSSVELGGQGTPYIDFSNDMTSDFDMRLILTGNDELLVDGGNLRVNGKVTASNLPGCYMITYSDGDPAPTNCVAGYYALVTAGCSLPGGGGNFLCCAYKNTPP